MRSSFLLGLLLINTFIASGQSKADLTLNAEQFLSIVRQYHPVVRLANINIDQSKADILIAQAAFNPRINSYFSDKTFQDTNYYNYRHPNITIPTWYGIDISTGIENLDGQRVDPSQTKGKFGYISVHIPLLKNLVLDKRRAYLKQAKIMNTMSATERQMIINDLLMNAIIAYWDWVNAYNSFNIITKALQTNKRRFELIKKSYTNGERPAIDTTEALTQLQLFELQVAESLLNFQNKSLELNVYFWKENFIPFNLPQDITPKESLENELFPIGFTDQLDQLKKLAQDYHPELQLYSQKDLFLQIDKKLKFQEFLPRLDLTYNHLAKGNSILNSQGFFLDNNYQYGLKFEMPLFLSQARGEYRKSKLKILENNIFSIQKRNAINVKLESYFNEFMILKKQIDVQINLLSNYQAMLRAEESLFLNGESSMFLLNNREIKVLENEIKLIELKTKYNKTMYSLQWCAGQLQ
ncbi:MAG TPA: TolC family protein [Saprospiraceae bacterium]|nr:TolC family protein [Saprospiraceae bacterium]